MRTALLKATPLLIAAMLLAGCSYQEVTLDRVNMVELLEMSKDSVKVSVGVTVNNPNNYRIRLADPDLDLYLNGNKLGKAVLEDDILLDKRIRREYQIPVGAAFNGNTGNLLLTMLGGVLNGGMTVRVQGTVLAKAGLYRKRVPFEFEQHLETGAP